MKGRLYTAETDGSLQVTDLTSGSRTPIGSAEFGKTTALVASGDELAAIETDGTLYRVDPQTAVRTRVVQPQGVKRLLGASCLKNQLYTIRGNGTLHETKVANGQSRQLGKPDFANTKFLFASSRELFTIETDGSLYEVFIHPVESIDGWDCFPREFEKVFQEQAKAFYQQSYPRQLLGAHATHRGIMEQLAWLQSNATAQDMVVIYFTSHGGTDPTEGWCVITADDKTFWGHELKAELAKLAATRWCLSKPAAAEALGNRTRRIRRCRPTSPSCVPACPISRPATNSTSRRSKRCGGEPISVTMGSSSWTSCYATSRCATR